LDGVSGKLADEYIKALEKQVSAEDDDDDGLPF
jgi:hypothetical protein